MIEIFKSKVMVLFMVLVIGVIFVDCSFNNNFDDTANNQNLIVVNS